MKFKKALKRLQRRVRSWQASMSRLPSHKQAAYKCPGSRKR